MIISAVKIEKLFIGQGWNRIRSPSRLVGIAGIREKNISRIAVQHALRRGKRSLHLIVDYSVIDERAFLRLQLIVPSLLHEDFLLIINTRMKYGIHIDVHQVLEILVIAACHRIYRLIRICHCI